MIKSGSREHKNVTQMAGCLRNRSSKVISELRWTDSPHFERYDNRPEARGFIESSFLKGLDPHEFFFFHAMAGGGTDRYCCENAGWHPIIVLKTEFAST
jgi:DNA-directed RNA polymerase II subunit RPB1